MRAFSLVGNGEVAVAEEASDRPFDLPEVPPRRSPDSMPDRAMRDEPALAQPGQVFSGEVSLVRAEFDGSLRRGPSAGQTWVCRGWAA